MEKTQLRRPRSVAVVGTGMAGLTTAHLLHQDREKRYQVTLLEKRDQISLSAESISVPSKEKNNPAIWADVPMRAFAGGFYQNLIRMYDYLAVNYHAQPFLFSFTRLPKPQDSSTTSCIPGPSMVYASNFHQVPPVPRTVDLIHWLVEAVYALACYVWFTFCCFFVAPHEEDQKTGAPSESLDHYLRRIWLPQTYVVNYLLPLISSVCTCSHHELLCFPASDVLAYKRQTHSQQHFVVTSGVQSVQQKLLQGIDVRLGINLTQVTPQNEGVQITYSAADEQTTSEYFDLVVLAVSPDVAASLFSPLNSQLSAIPTTTVETVAHTDETSILPMLRATSSLSLKKRNSDLSSRTQRIHFFSNDCITEAVHEQPNSILVTTNPLFPLDKSKIIRSANFTRVLRSPQSRMFINSIFRDRSQRKVSPYSWHSGDNGVYLAGGWCWDGMVLLEGCIVSAMRVAADLGVTVPWDSAE
ncbi:hypothetical protein N7448_000995 [Penicillium atrosanguineum]|uniref:Amine oxidase domain-containing protein n=1 Tax=Penicillium atrosanguineum TaxID=1132637 RepID=A0A9W9U7V2_9EURO|nr:FMN-binding split barrel-like protein [Penicillium atrosanguineum]KAJ5149417.1 hypothetical protein N7448_000995 [Penicillium atrosanguineum]KAJ5304733.1 FMN-binding split barrel-like protein [Penicillium atrosanguineum]KAJ5324196.1 hypothetical protein N7476_002796 [Penicillium atrosanguineum]